MKILLAILLLPCCVAYKTPETTFVMIGTNSKYLRTTEIEMHDTNQSDASRAIGMQVITNTAIKAGSEVLKPVANGVGNLIKNQ